MADIALHHADCLTAMQALAAASIDLILADPPFNAGKEYKGGHNDAMPVADYYHWLGDRLEEMVRVLKPGGTLWLMNDQRHIGWCQIKLLDLGLDFRNLVVWAYTNPTPAQMGLPRTWRPILFMSKGKPRFFNPRGDEMTKPTLYHNPQRGQSHWPHDLWPDIPKLVGGFLAPPELLRDDDGRFAHLAQMPVRIAERILKLATEPGDLVLDPFMGSGTTGEAALLLERRFIGCESSLEYFQLAERRLVFPKRFA